VQQGGILCSKMAAWKAHAYAQNFLTVREEYIAIHSFPCACTGIYVVPRMKRRSSAVRWGFDAYSLRFRARFTHHRAMFVEGDPGRLKRHPPRTHQPFDEQRSIIDFLRTEPQRIDIGDLTNCGRFAPSLCALKRKQMPVHAHGSLWIPNCSP